MRLVDIVTLIGIAFLIAGCAATDDFKVVEALHKGMSMQEAKTTIESYSFQRHSIITRSKEGWEESDDITDLSKRALRVEEKLNITIETAEYYPVSHGILGFGQLFLFYDKEGSLVYYYRKQIN